MPVHSTARFAPQTRLLLAIALCTLAVGAGLRLLLWAQFGIAAQVPVSALPGIFGRGLLVDVLELPYLLLPVCLALWLLPASWQGPRLKRLLPLGFGLVVFGMLFLAGLEYFFFEEFDARFNLVAVDYLIYPTEVLGNINDTYPVGAISAALAVVAVLVVLALWPTIQPAPGSVGLPRRQRAGWLLANVAAVFVVAFSVRADAAHHSANRVANELAANGPASFFAAFRANHLEYPAYYRMGEPQAMKALLQADLARGGGAFNPQRALGLSRQFAARPEGLGQRNVVVLSEESFGAEFVGAYGDTRGLTPEFDALSREGLLFTNAYATGTRTVRGLEALTASFPPIPSESILKREGNTGMATLGSVLAGLGYSTRFIYGGYGTFDNMNAFYRGNGFGVSDRTDIANPRFANIWGVSDEDLFAHAIARFDADAASGKPFFGLVMSTSNHKPYTFPEGVPGVKAKGGGRTAGIRYADHAIGEFFRAARSKPWFNNTVFVVVADHGARVYGAAQIPLFSYEIPLLILAPGAVAPAHIATPTSQIDVAPTVLGLLGLPHEAPFFGQDVLHWQGGPRSLLFNHNHDVALFRDGQLAILGLQGKTRCQSYQRAAGAAQRGSDRFTDIACPPALLDLATAYYQTG